MRAGRPRLVAFDLDGTFLRSDGTIAPRSAGALDRIKRAGAHYVFVTGRPPRYTASTLGPFGYRGTVICANGALTYDMGRGVITGQRLIPALALAQAAARLRRAIPGLGIAVEREDRMVRDQYYEPGAWGGIETMPVLPDTGLFVRDAVKLLGRHPTLSADELLALATPAVGELVAVYHSGGSRLLEATAAGVSKGTALAALAGQLGIPAAEVAAFGDMINDLPMLSWAGTSYGMANAHPAVLAAVDQVIPSNDDDGVATIIEQLFPDAP